MRRKFNKRTEEKLRSTESYNKMTEAIKKDKRPRNAKDKAKNAKGESLEPAEFTKFMGNFHDQNQETIECHSFSVPDDMIMDVSLSISKGKKKQVPRCGRNS